MMGNWGEATISSMSSFSANALSKADFATLVTQIIRTTANKARDNYSEFESIKRAIMQKQEGLKQKSRSFTVNVMVNKYHVYKSTEILGKL